MLSLIGHQTEILYVPDNQNMVITGSAGCGKSLLAIYRVYWLAKKYPHEKVVLLTFNSAVNKDMKRKITYLGYMRDEKWPSNLKVMTYHKFMIEVISTIVSKYADKYSELSKYQSDTQSGVKTYNSARSKSTQVMKALQIIEQEYEDESTFKRPLQTFIDEISWLQQMSITSLEEYEKAERIGRRGTRVERSKRKYFYEVYQKYLEIREHENHKYYDFDDVGSVVRNLLNHIEGENNSDELLSYKYILVDEFQDFTSDMLKTVNALSNQTGAMVLLGDINQGVFGKRISFKSLGINMNSYRKYELLQNYRNSYPISKFAEVIADSSLFDKKNEFYTEASLGVRDGTKPALVECESEEDELEKIYRYITSQQVKMAQEQVCIIIPTNRFTQFKNYMSQKDVNIFSVTQLGYGALPKLLVGSYRQIKGLEFDTVLMPYLSKKVFIECVKEDNAELEIDENTLDLNDINSEILEQYLAQYYVGVTRAKNKLVLLYSGERTPLLADPAFDEYVVEKRDA